MAYVRSTEAIVLKTHDIGEADRLCILFTKNFGRLAARARAVRKLTSKNGGNLLPLQYISVDLAESSAGYTVTRATCINSHDVCRHDFTCFFYAEQMVTMLQKHLEDGTAATSLFQLARDFLLLCETHSPAFLFSVFSIAFFHDVGALASLRHSIVSHKPLSSPDLLVMSRRFGGVCLQEEDPAGRHLPFEVVSLLWHCTEHGLKNLPFVSPELAHEFTSISMSLFEPGMLAPLPVSLGSSSCVTPTW